MIRQPIITIMGHVDHGKTSIADSIRGSAIAAKEAGGITQAIGASIIPIETVKKICGPLLEAMRLKFTIPGLLFIDTPGHAAFTNLRKRGGNLADIAIVVIDIMEGVKPQTIECIEILKNYKTPFIIAANKIDLINGWQSRQGTLLQKIMSQQPDTLRLFETKLYELVGKLFELGFNAERFDRVEDYTKQVAIVPVSAKTKDGIPELLMVLTGLAQKYLENALKIDVAGTCEGTVLEIKEEKGLGTTMDAIIYNGTLSVGDTIVVGGLSGAMAVKVKALFVPAPLAEMRDKKAKFKSIRQVSAATGVKISAPGIENAIAGSPVVGAGDDIEKAKAKVQQEIEQVLIETGAEGIVIKADSLGSLEALSGLLKERGIPVKSASVGPISKRDISAAQSNLASDPLKAVVLGFNVSCQDEGTAGVKIITSDIIYRLIEEYEAWQLEKKKEMERSALEQLTRPCKIRLLKGYVFRQSNPAVVGVEVLSGILSAGVQLMNTEGKILTPVREIQEEQKSISTAQKGKQVAIAMPDVIVGRQVHEDDVLYSFIPEEDFRKLKEFKNYLSEDEKNLLKEIAVLMRKKNPVWGV